MFHYGIYIYLYIIIESWWYQLNPIVMILYIYKYIYTQFPIFAYEMVIYHMKYHHKLILTVKPLYIPTGFYCLCYPIVWKLKPILGGSSPLSGLVRVAFFVPLDIWGPPFELAFSWGLHNSNFTMVYGTQITIVNAVYKPTYNWGASHCRYNLFEVQHATYTTGITPRKCGLHHGAPDSPRTPDSPPGLAPAPLARSFCGHREPTEGGSTLDRP